MQVLRSTLVRSLPIYDLTDVVMTSSGSLRQDGEGRLVIATGVRADLDATLESVRYFRFFASSLPRPRSFVRASAVLWAGAASCDHASSSP